MREVANFMQMYPAYTLRAVLEEYAITFYALLNEGYKVRLRHYRMLAQIADLPMLEQEDRRKFYTMIDWATKDPDDILGLNGTPSTDAEIKRALG